MNNKVINYNITYFTGGALKDAYETVKPGVEVVLYYGKSAKPSAILTGFPKHVEVIVPSTVMGDQTADDFSALVPDAEIDGWNFNEDLNSWIADFKYAKNLATVSKADGFVRFTPPPLTTKAAVKSTRKPAAKKTATRKVAAKKTATRKPAAKKVAANGKVVKPTTKAAPKVVSVEIVTLKKGDKFMRYGKTYNVAVKQRNGEVKVNGPAGFTTFPNDTKVKVNA